MTDRDLGHLAPAEAFLARAAARPRLILSLITLAVIGWIIVALSATHMAMPSGQAWHVGDFIAAALIWAAMTLAMMLPSAAPMVVTYAEIAETAAQKGERIVSPFVLAAGYLFVWFGFAVGAAVLQGAMTHLALLDATSESTSGLLSAALFVGAGLYQFSRLKNVCLTQCQQPLPFFFANWTSKPLGVFRLGLWQGIYCVGCCWVFMLLMFAVGVMNIMWLLALALVVIGEKMSNRLTRPLGLLLIVLGGVFAVSAGRMS